MFSLFLYYIGVIVFGFSNIHLFICFVFKRVVALLRLYLLIVIVLFIAAWNDAVMIRARLFVCALGKLILFASDSV